MKSWPEEIKERTAGLRNCTVHQPRYEPDLNRRCEPHIRCFTYAWRPFFLQGLKMKVFAICCSSLYLVVVPGAHAADAETGKRLAQLRCVACHIVDRSQGNEVADAAPFVVIGRKYEFNSDSLVFALMGPHAKMNFSLAKREADDVAAYIATLAR
jgi:mono/diheme cytochrome c family protein